MRSHEYCQFEVCLPLPPALVAEQSGMSVPQAASLIRIEAAKLVDLAVRDYDRMKLVIAARNTLASGTTIDDLRQDVKDILTVPVERRSPQQKAIVKAVADYDHHNGRNDTEYDYTDQWDNP
jgi:hypothetical protein